MSIDHKKDNEQPAPDFHNLKNKSVSDVRPDSSFYQELFRNSPSAILVVNNSGLIISANNACQNLFDIKPENLLNQKFVNLLEKNHQHPVEFYFDKCKSVFNYLDDLVILRNGKNFVLRKSMFVLNRVEDEDYLTVFLGTPELLDQSYLEVLNSDIHFKKIIENSKIGINVFDREGHYLDVNESWENLLGYSKEEACQKTFLDFTHPEDREISKYNFEQILSGKFKSHRYTKRYLSKNGNDVWCDVVINCIYDFNQQLEAILALIIDISDAVEAWELIEKSQRRLELALNAANEGLWDFNVKTRETFYSPRYYEMLGYEINEFKASQESFKNLLHPDDRKKVLNTVKRFHENKIPQYEQEFRLKTKDGKYRWILSRGKVVEHDNNGQALRIIGTHSDITRRKNALEKLKKSESLLLAAVEIAELGYWEYDINRDELILNEDFVRIVYRSDPEEFGKMIYKSDEFFKKFVHVDERYSLRKAIIESVNAREANHVTQFETRILRSDGAERDYLGFFRVNLNRNNVPKRLYGVIQDITERKIAQKNEIEMNRIKLANQLVKTIAHEFNNPLAILRGSVDLIQMPGLPDELREQNLQKLSPTIERLHNLVEKLLELEDLKEVDYVDGIKIIDIHKKPE